MYLTDQICCDGIQIEPFAVCIEWFSKMVFPCITFARADHMKALGLHSLAAFIKCLSHAANPISSRREINSPPAWGRYEP